jgi:hypothetical protein
MAERIEERGSARSGRSVQENHSAENAVIPRLRFGLVCGSFAEVARQLSGWTTNLLATAIVLLGGLTLGWQVVGWWKEEPPSLAIQPAGLEDAELPMLRKDREFWTRGGLLKVERVAGGLNEATAVMRAFCREGGLASQRAEGGKGEAEFVEKLIRQTPLEETGNVAVYQPAGQRAMVVAVDRGAKRIVGWSFAMEAEQGAWSIYHFRPAGNRAADVKLPGG